ncbi:MAG: penicillin-binding protein 1A [Candidatus Midichloriaceae bacterium]|jgi:penicillin-binding protein 1A
MFKKIFTLSFFLFSFFVASGFLIMIEMMGFIKDIPNYNELATYNLPGITRLYDSKGEILDEYAKEKRIYVYYDNIPKNIINAFIAVEDKNFFEHQGIDFTSILRASVQNIGNFINKKRFVGGSTITQQVVKGFFLSNERTLSRKLKEAVLAYRVNKMFSKEKLLELYLNQIYLGRHAHGIYMAAYVYFGKSLDDLSIQEAALLASLPKAPSMLNPYKNQNRSLERRNWALSRMEEEGFISMEEKKEAVESPIVLSYTPIRKNVYEDYYTNTVRLELLEMFGEDKLYTNTYTVNTNLDMNIQEISKKVLKKGLENFDKLKGWRGPVSKINVKDSDVYEELEKLSKSIFHSNFQLGMVHKFNENSINFLIDKDTEITLTKEGYEWILKSKKDAKGNIKRLLNIGDVVMLKKLHNGKFTIDQIPLVNGALVVIENRTGNVLSLVGGYDFKQSKFNRAIQAYRQPGSAFKTFLYLAALEQGIKPNTMILDEPLEVDLGHGLPKWNPKNYGDNYYGLITMRASFEKSRNLSTLRLLLGIGIEKLVEIAHRYLIYINPIKATYSMGLGAFETTLLKLTNAYSSIANNGILKQPKLIDSVYNMKGKNVYSPKDYFCKGCQGPHLGSDKMPEIGYLGKNITDQASNYQILSLLEGAVERGSARRAKVLNRVVAGKTGTTNDSFDTWFVGMTPDITVGIFVGYDTPKNMGKYATGSSVTLPIFVDFFKNAEFIPNRKFEIPEEIEHHYVDQKDGEIHKDVNNLNMKNLILENFKKEESSEKNLKNFDILEEKEFTYQNADENSDISIFDFMQDSNEDNKNR